LNDFNLHTLIAISGTSSFSLTDVTVSNPTGLEEAMHLYIGTTPLYGMTSLAGTTFTQSLSTPIEFAGADLIVGCDNCTASAEMAFTLRGRSHWGKFLLGLTMGVESRLQEGRQADRP